MSSIRTAFDAHILGQAWKGTAPGVWRRGAVTVKYLANPLGRGDTGGGFLATAPAQSAWAPSADAAVAKLMERAEMTLRSIHRGRAHP